MVGDAKCEGIKQRMWCTGEKPVVILNWTIFKKRLGGKQGVSQEEGQRVHSVSSGPMHGPFHGSLPGTFK